MAGTGKTKRWMIYGVYGYTGQLIAEEAVRRGFTPILAGRDPQKTIEVANALGLECRTFSLTDKAEVKKNIADIDLLLNCAGPFSTTAEVMMDICSQLGTHYLDITGEIAVFELAQSFSQQARQTGAVICPGVGFDVIPTDCVAAILKFALPDATQLSLGFDSRSGFSPGTAKTSIEGLADGGKIRRNGIIRTVPLAYDVKKIDFGNGEKLAMTIPWGDISTAYHSTGIQNIDVYIPSSEKMVRQARRANLIRPLLKLSIIQSLAKFWISKKVKGPSHKERERYPTYVWGEATNANGDTATARIKTANGYHLTMIGAIEVVSFLLENGCVGGTYTPSQLMGADFIERLSGDESIILS